MMGKYFLQLFIYIVYLLIQDSLTKEECTGTNKMARGEGIESGVSYPLMILS